MALLTARLARRIGGATAVLWMLFGLQPSAQSPAAIEENIKAVFLFNFTKYVTFPATEDPTPADVRICVTDDNPFFELLKAALEGEDVEGRPLVAVTLEGLDDARTCQVLYVGDSQTLDAKAWLGAVRNAQVLTVADGTLTDETVIAFVRDDNRIRFDINRAAASRHGVNVSSKLLRLARRVRDR